jgi:hypothetical protein
VERRIEVVAVVVEGAVVVGMGMLEVRSLVKRPLAKVATEMRLANFHWQSTLRS